VCAKGEKERKKFWYFAENVINENFCSLCSVSAFALTVGKSNLKFAFSDYREEFESFLFFHLSVLKILSTLVLIF
jgi:hypothetical protein